MERIIVIKYLDIISYLMDNPHDIITNPIANRTGKWFYAYVENGKAEYVMDAAMHMIHGMDLGIVAEGIETEPQLETMKTLGIQYIQGYYFSKPLSEQHFLDFIKEKNADETGGVA